MNERQSDFGLLREFARDGRQAAFTALVRRHLDLVYATSLRKAGDAGGAEEIAQNVFSALARKAWQFAPDDSLPAWLYKTALLESKSWLRGELRRRRREQTAAELGTTMKTPDDQPAFNALVPMLDDALLSLREKDRTALLLRFYESHSLRQVGAAFGVSEDTAQKRVQGALEKLAEFYKRRGFKTATVAATAAALQHTASSASAGLVSTVVGAALKGAPPALVGLGAWLARLASLTRVQTAALCVALTAVPVAWQLNQRHAAGEEAKQIQTQLLATQNEAAATQSDLERMQATFARLQPAAAQQKQEADRAAESARAFDVWKRNTRSQLMAADYRWSDDSAFARIPKSVLPELNQLAKPTPFSPPGVVNPYERELLGLTPAQRQALEETLRPVAEAQYGDKAEAYERDNPLGGQVIASKIFADQPSGKVGAESEQRFAQLLADIRGILGEERWLVLPVRFTSNNCDVWNPALIPAATGSLQVRVENDEQGILRASWNYTGTIPGAASPNAANPGRGPVYSQNVVGYMNGTAALSAFLPGSDTDQTKAAENPVAVVAPEPFRKRASAWLQAQAAARLGQKENP